jgi:hypothetical protein
MLNLPGGVRHGRVAKGFQTSPEERSRPPPLRVGADLFADLSFSSHKIRQESQPS